MKKTEKMLEVEARIGEPLEGYLARRYNTDEATIQDIATDLQVSGGTVYRWLRDSDGIELRTMKEAQGISARKRYLVKTPQMLEAEKKIGEPLEIYLKREYAERRVPSTRIGETLGYPVITILRWMDRFGIERRGKQECRLPPNAEIPSKTQLEEWIRDGASQNEMAILSHLGLSTIRKLLKEHGLIGIYQGGGNYSPDRRSLPRDDTVQLSDEGYTGTVRHPDVTIFDIDLDDDKIYLDMNNVSAGGHLNIELQRWIDEGRSIGEIARYAQVRNGEVRKACLEYGIVLPSWRTKKRREARRKLRKLKEKGNQLGESLRTLLPRIYFEEQSDVDDIAELTGYSIVTTKKLILMYSRKISYRNELRPIDELYTGWLVDNQSSTTERSAPHPMGRYLQTERSHPIDHSNQLIILLDEFGSQKLNRDLQDENTEKTTSETKTDTKKP